MSFTYCVHVGALRGQEDAGCPGTGVTNSGESPNVGRVLPHSSGLSELKACVKINTPFLESVFSFFQWLKYHFFCMCSQNKIKVTTGTILNVISFLRRGFV